jgi:predicted lipoprotein with Yx(FWY)xxD motif
MSTKIKLISLASISFFLILVATSQQTIGISNNNLGNYLVDESGMTLYHFRGDSPGESTCYGDCLSTWLPFYTVNINVAGGINAYDFATISREDGKLQIAYKGWPLYQYKGDSLPGDVKGHGLNNMWFIMSP